jgi:hypothetical protein
MHYLVPRTKRSSSFLRHTDRCEPVMLCLEVRVDEDRVLVETRMCPSIRLSVAAIGVLCREGEAQAPHTVPRMQAPPAPLQPCCADGRRQQPPASSSCVTRRARCGCEGGDIALLSTCSHGGRPNAHMVYHSQPHRQNTAPAEAYKRDRK